MPLNEITQLLVPAVPEDSGGLRRNANSAVSQGLRSQAWFPFADCSLQTQSGCGLVHGRELWEAPPPLMKVFPRRTGGRQANLPLTREQGVEHLEAELMVLPSLFSSDL